MGMGNVIVKKQVISSALALTVIAGDLGVWGNDNESGRTKIQYHQEFKTPAYIGEEWKAPEGLDKRDSLSILRE